jgi:hypothetical protein
MTPLITLQFSCPLACLQITHRDHGVMSVIISGLSLPDVGVIIA